MITVHQAAQIPAYQGPHELDGLRFRHARQTLGVSAWGMNVLEFEPHCSNYPTHDHAKEGQEEVYVVLSGSLVLEADGQRYPLPTGAMVRVPAETPRKLVTEADSALVLALGATPGTAYTPAPGM